MNGDEVGGWNDGDGERQTDIPDEDECTVVS